MQCDKLNILLLGFERFRHRHWEPAGSQRNQQESAPANSTRCAWYAYKVGLKRIDATACHAATVSRRVIQLTRAPLYRIIRRSVGRTGVMNAASRGKVITCHPSAIRTLAGNPICQSIQRVKLLIAIPLSLPCCRWGGDYVSRQNVSPKMTRADDTRRPGSD